MSSILKYIRKGQIESVHSIIEEFGEVIYVEAIETSSIIGITLKEIKLPKNVISDSTICYDLSYDSLPTKFMEWSMECGAEKAIQGWGMLVEQAAESYYLWKNIRPDTSSILEQLEITSSSQVLQR